MMKTTVWIFAFMAAIAVTAGWNISQSEVIHITVAITDDFFKIYTND